MRVRAVAILLFVWEPLNFAAKALQVLPTLEYRGRLAGLELLAHGLVAALCAASGLALWNSGPDARRLARAALIVSTVRVLQSLYWSALPRNTPPGHEPLYAAGALLIATAALLALHSGAT